MKEGNAGDQLAVLIDGDNVSHRVVAALMAEVASYGNASVRRVYGDWTSPAMKSWTECLLEHSIAPIQQFAYTTGKNATDGAMIIDAMDLLYTGCFSSFCLVSSDSDFTRLATRIREQGISVYGFGNRHNTHRALVAACNEFVYFDALPLQKDEPAESAMATRPAVLEPHASALSTGEPDSSGQRLNSSADYKPPANRNSLQDPHSLMHRLNISIDNKSHTSSQPNRRPLDKRALAGLRKAISSCEVYEDDFVNLAVVGDYLTRISPDLHARNFGYARLSEFVVASGIVQLRKKSIGGAPPIALVRLKGKS